MDCDISLSCPPPLGHRWISNTQLGIYAKSPKGLKSPSSLSIQEVKWGTSMTCDEFMRRLTKTSYESSEDIDEARAMHLAAEGDLIQVFEIIWHLAELIFIQVSPSGHLSYNLCSWFYVQSQEAANNARKFLEKANEYQPNQRGLTPMPSVEKDEQFWPTVLTLVLQARSQEAASLLILHSHSNSRGLRSLRQLLAAMPFVSPSKGEGSWTETGALFSQAWSYWQSECENRLGSGEFDNVGGDLESIAYVKLIVSVLAGRQSVWNDSRLIQATGGLRGWYFRFAAFVFYTDQLVNLDGLSRDLNRWLSLSPQSSDGFENTLDQTINELITSIFRLDLFSFLRIASEKLSNWWLVFHFTNLMDRVCPGLLTDFQLNQDQSTWVGDKHKQEPNGSSETHKLLSSTVSRNPETSSLTEFLLLGYVESLASESSLLNVTMGYLDHCQTAKMRQSALILRHGFPSSTRATNWLIGQARIRDLNTTAEQLARVASRRLLPLVFRDVNPPNCPKFLFGLPSCAALGWALLARDHSIINRIAELALARDCGFVAKSESDREHPDQSSSPSSTEVAELAAVVLSFSRESNLFKPSTESTHTTSQSKPSNSGQPNRFGLSPELAFLVRYAELQQCFNSGDCEGAIDRLIDLLITSPSSSSPCLMDKVSMDHASNPFSGSSSQIGIHIPTRLRLRLLAEVRHLLGRGCLRRDQVELLITALVELRSDLDSTPDAYGTGTLALLSKIHASLARELAQTFFTSDQMDPVDFAKPIPTPSY